MQIIGVQRRPAEAIFVGRRAELARLAGFARAHAPRVLFVHGLAGAGKSTLLQQTAASLDHAGTVVAVLDCRTIEPTEAGFFAALHAALDLTGSPAGALTERTDRLGGVAARVVIGLDQYEVYRLLDTWLRQQLVPGLPSNVRLVLSGRQAPNPAWLRLPPGSFETLELGPLSRDESAELLAAVGAPARMVPRITRFAGGHPLTLLLAALAAKEQPAMRVEDVTPRPAAHRVRNRLPRRSRRRDPASARGSRGCAPRHAAAARRDAARG